VFGDQTQENRPPVSVFGDQTQENRPPVSVFGDQTQENRPLVSPRPADEGFRMLILSDHKTLTTTRGHDGSPVPYIIYDSRFDRATGLTFCEQDAARGQHIAAGTELMGILFEKT